MADVQVTQGAIRILGTGVAERLDVVQAAARVVFNFPTEFTRVTQAAVRVVDEPYTDVRVQQALIRTIIYGRVDDPQVRVWTFELDQHDYYVIRLGNDGTLVYDLYADQWYIWGSGDTELWRAFTGTNWLQPGQNAQSFGSNIVVGDDGAGTIWFLDPSADVDEDALEGSEKPRPFLRKATSQVAIRGYDSVPCYGLELLGSSGQSALQGVTLFTSDTRGTSYVDRGTIDVALDDFDTRLNWRSIGSMKNLGRLFRIEDRGALKRIDSLTLEGDEEE